MTVSGVEHDFTIAFQAGLPIEVAGSIDDQPQPPGRGQHAKASIVNRQLVGEVKEPPHRIIALPKRRDGGWQGAIIDVGEAESTVCIAWDSQTLEAMPPALIDHCEEEGLAWDEMYLDVSEVETAPRRDTPTQRAQVLARLQAQHRWSHLGDEGAQIKEAIGAVDPGDEWAVLEAWASHLRQVLRFPFEAQIAEPQGRGPLRLGDRLTVLAITDIDDLHGLIVRATHQGHRVELPLCDLKVADPRSPNHDPVQAYAVWFANR